MEGIERPVVETLEEQEEPEDGRNPERGGKEPTRLPERVHKENADKDSNRARESNRIVWSNPYESGNLKLPEHKTYESEGTVERHKSPESPKLEPADEISLSFWTP